eukprot:m.26785 g.26785  ORF g.26785 m.26785 type:complete len:826 (+) comp13381_c0_seq2:48-2525(+)
MNTLVLSIALAMTTLGLITASSVAGFPKRMHPTVFGSTENTVLVPANNINITAHACLLTNASKLPFCNSSLPRSERVADLVSRLTTQEKICLMGSINTCSVPRLGLPVYNWGVEDLHGAGTQCLIGADGKSHCPTIFPTLAMMAASMNTTAWERIGTVIGTEMRVANNVGGTRDRDPGRNRPIGVNGWGPNLNIARDPRWGRNSEVPSEDAFLAGMVGAAMTRGIQGDPSAKYRLCLGALKHVTAYSLENWKDDTGGPRDGTKYSRFGFSGNISLHDLAETYLDQYRIAIRDSNPLGMMCSYSAINGTASCENPKLLTKWARESQGFQGNVVTDCGALSMSSEPSDVSKSSADALNAGTDLNCGSTYEHGLQNAVSSGQTTMAAIDASVTLSMGLLMDAGYFDPLEDQPYAAIPPEAVGSAASHALARETALQGLVLLRNERQALPLQASKTTAVLGPLANATLELASRYYDAVCPGPLNTSLHWLNGERPSGCIVSPVAALAQRGTVLHESGVVCPDEYPANRCIESTDTGGIAAAVAAAQKADQIVMFVGLHHSHGGETEGTDRQDLTLHGVQNELIEAVRKAAPSTPLVVVVMNGGAVAMDYFQADAVVESFYAGIEGADAIACSLYGEAGCNRWGKLPMTIYPETFVKNDMANMGVSTGGSGMRTYKYYTDEFGAPLFPFGHGLSLNTYALEWTTPPASLVVSPTTNATITATVTNLGAREGDEVVMLYHVPDRAYLRIDDTSIPLPRARLAGFERVHLAAGEHAVITFTITAETLELFDNAGNAVLYSGKHTVQLSRGHGDTVSTPVDVHATTTLRTLEW